MRILVLGGTGAMGMPVVQILAEREYTVYVTTRKNRRSSRENVRYITGNAHDLEFVCSILKERYDVIVDFMIYYPSEFQSHIEILQNNTDQYIFMSSARVYADSPNEVITEKSQRLLDVTEDESYLATNEYALAKAREEDHLINSPIGNYTIIRPYITYYNERLQLGIYEKELWLQRVLEGKKIIFSEEIAKKYTTLTHGYDVALRIADLVGNPEAIGEVYQIAMSQNIRWGDVLNIYLDVLEAYLGKRPEVCMTKYSDPLTEKTNHYQIYCDRIYDRKFCDQKIQMATREVRPFISPEEGLKDCMKNFLRGEKRFTYRDWKLEAVFDRLSGDVTPIREIDGCKNKLKYLMYRYLKKV